MIVAQATPAPAKMVAVKRSADDSFTFNDLARVLELINVCQLISFHLLLLLLLFF